MATRMQQRRGTAAQWTSANPILNAGEMGWESDTNKFKIGDGTNHWADLDYFIDQSSTVNPAFGSSITFEGATSDAYETTLTVADPTADRTITLPNSTGTVVLADGSGNVTVSGNLTVQGTTTTVDSTTINLTTSITFEGSTADAYETTLNVVDPTADRFVTLPNATGTVITTGNLSDTGATATELGYLSGVTSAIQTQFSNITTDVSAKAPTASPTFTGTVVLPSTTSIGDVSSAEIGYVNGVTSAIQTQIDTKAPAASPTFTGNVVLPSTTSIGDVSETELSYVNGVTSAIQTQLDAKSPSADPTFTGTVVLPSTTSIGDVSSTEIGYVNGVTSAIQTQLDDKLASASAASTYAPLASPALTGTPTAPTADANTNTTQIATTAFVKTAVDNVIASAPGALDTLNELAEALGDDANFSTTVTNSIATKAPLASPTFTGTVTVAADGIAFTDGTQTKEGVPSRTTINTASASYNLSTGGLTLRDTMLELGSSSAITLTIPANSTTAYPVGTSIDIIQTGAGQVTVAGAAGVTVNATPGLKLRAQYSSATLFKRATDTWIVMGDLSA